MAEGVPGGFLDHRGRPRVVVTGIGAVSPLGLTADELWDGLVAGRSGIGSFTLIDSTGYPCQAVGEVKGFDPRHHMDAKEARRMGRFSQFAVAAARMAAEHAALDLDREDRDRVGVVMGNGNGGFPTLEQECAVLVTKGGMKMNPFFFPIVLPNMAASHVSMQLGAKGLNTTVVTACAAGTQAIGEAAEVLRRGAADVAFAGGTEAGISHLGLAGFCVMRALSTNKEPEKASRPFDAKRDGFVPGEGSGVLILETLEHAVGRKAPILCELAGYGASADAYHLVAPDPTGEGAIRAMRWAIEDAGLTTEDVSYINAHATSTPLNDLTETVAIKRLFGQRAYHVPVSATKSMVGHALGGAGAIEAVVCVQTIRHQVIHPTVNYEYPDPECDLDYVPNAARPADVQVVLSNSFGFGGQNACLVFKRLPSPTPAPRAGWFDA